MLICILGNSHAAALKHGWDLISDKNPAHDVHFFSMLGQNLGLLRLEGGTLCLPGKERSLRSFPAAAGDEVKIDRYEAFVLHGLGLRATPMERQEGVSRACHDCAVSDSIRCTAAWSLLTDIRKVSEVPVRVGATPLRAAEEVLSRDAGAALEEHAKLLQSFLETQQAQFISQPHETIVNGHETDPIYNVGVVPILKDASTANTDERHSDRNHMNPAYGQKMMEEYLVSLEESSLPQRVEFGN